MPVEYKTCPSCSQTVWYHTGGCDRCGRKMTKVFPEREYTTQFVGALAVDVQGGWGMYFDGPPARYVLCHECAEELLKKEPWVQPQEFGG